MTCLTDVEPGAIITVARIESRNSPRLQRLAAFGIVPGVAVRLVAKRPTFVLEFDHTSLAIDADVAREIYVTRRS